MKIFQYRIGQIIRVNDQMQQDYSYVLSREIGRKAADFNQQGFEPHLSPAEMLKKGVFEGHYLNDCTTEFPEEWFIESASKRSERANPENNYFKVKSRLSLKEWQVRKWIIGDDPRGWFQWYCRYYLGRRTTYDHLQIARWRSYKRHLAQVKIHCKQHEHSCRPRQRQGLLQWAYDALV